MVFKLADVTMATKVGLAAAAVMSCCKFPSSVIFDLEYPVYSFGYSDKMHNEPYPSRASASRGSSRTSSRTRKQQKAVDRRSFRCDKKNCEASFSCRYDLFRHEESIHAWNLQHSFDQCKYKTENVDKLKDHISNLHSLSSKFHFMDFCNFLMTNINPGPNAQTYKTSDDSQSYQTYAMQREEDMEHVNIDGLTNLDEIDEPSEVESGYDTTYTSFSFSDDVDDSDDSMVPYPNASANLYGIGHWVDDHLSSGTTWTAWQNPNVLLEHAFAFSAASIKKKPHVEEAMDCFRSSFYGVRASSAEYPYC